MILRVEKSPPGYALRMENTPTAGLPARLADAGLAVLARRGAAGFSARAAEEEAGAPHGSVRYHFGGHAGLVSAMTQRLVELELDGAEADPLGTTADWLGAHRERTRARYELLVLALRGGDVSERFLAGRDAVVAQAVAATGLPAERARGLVAAVDGLVLDAMLRGEAALDPADLRAVMAGFLGAGPGALRLPDDPRSPREE
ncbi:hypothetical protein USB125703_01468 [Pseudoclavibacter triregionum]|nr:hypothetical protein USB125703_01468 [Pseudoclavibacter triregionum]